MSLIDTLFAVNDNRPKRVRDHKARWAKRNAKEPERECKHCGSLFCAAPSKGSPRLYCSTPCRNAGIAAVVSARATSGRVSYTVYRPQCAHCCKRYTARSASHILCSDECAAAYSLERANAQNRERAPLKNERRCIECNSAFTPAYGDKRIHFCSTECGKRRNGRVVNSRRRARLRGVANDNVDPMRVFERDGWTCRECGIETPRYLRGTYDASAPELDHIFPVARGGAHTYGNTQLLCRSCNNRKSDRITANDNRAPDLFANAS